MSIFKYHLKIIRYKRRRAKELNSLDYGEEEDQYFLVSYPKSGNTWVRVLIANLLNDDPEKEIAFHNVGEFIPDSHNPRQRAYIKGEEPGFSDQPIQVVKSHDRYKKHFKNKKVIYLVRSGGNVISSFYHYLNARSEAGVSFKDIIQGRASHSFGGWFSHVSKWISANNKKILFIQYEKMRQHPQKELMKVASFLRLETTPEKVSGAIARSSFDRMKQLEEKYGYFNDNRTKDGKSTPFVRKGSTQKENSEIPENLVGTIKAQQERVDKKLQELK